MRLLEHSLRWVRGEILEASLTGCLGVALLVLALVCWKWGTTPNVRALVVPLLVVASLFGGAGFFGALSNRARIPSFSGASSESRKNDEEGS